MVDPSAPRVSLRAVVFDLDGVLVASQEAHWKAYCRAFALKGIPFTYEDYVRVGRGAPREVVFRSVLGDSVPADRLETLMEAKERFLSEDLASSGLPTIPGAGEFALLAHRRGLRIAVASASRTPDLLLRAAGLPDIFDVVLGRHAVQRPKPHPDVYLAAASGLGVEPGRCLAIEDSPVGITAGIAAGMTVVGLATTHETGELQDAHAVYRGFAEVDAKRWLGP